MSSNAVSKSLKTPPQSIISNNNNNTINNNCVQLDDQKRFKCDICGSSYKHLRNLRAHCHLHTGKTKCDLCNKVLCNRSYFRKHLLHQHGIADNPYEELDEQDTGGQTVSHSVFENLHMDNIVGDKDEGSEEEEEIEDSVHTLSHSVFD